MSAKLEDRLQPGERVLYRETRGRSSWRIIARLPGLLPLFGIIVGVMNRSPEISFLSLLLYMFISRVTESLYSGRAIETLVTNLRIMQSKSLVEGHDVTELATIQVEAVEHFAGAIRITCRDGPPLVFDDLDGGFNAALAVSQAAGLPLPYQPSPRGRLAEEILRAVAIVSGALAFAVVIGNPSLNAVFESEAWSTLLLALTASATFLVGALLGIGAGLLFLRPYFSRDDMRAWIRQSAPFAPSTKMPSQMGPIDRCCLWFVDLLYAAPAPPDTQSRSR